MADRSQMTRVRIFATACLLSGVVGSASVAAADHGEFKDAAVASLISGTKKAERTTLSAEAGGVLLMGLDAHRSIHAQPFRVTGDLAFYGVHLDRHSRLFPVRGSVGIGLRDSGSFLDAYEGSLTVFHHLGSGAISLGVLEVSRERALGEQFAVRARSFEYSAGGALKHFIFTLQTTALGYEFRRYFRGAGRDYHGLYIAGLGLRTGFLAGRRKPVSFESMLSGAVDISWPGQRDAQTELALILHFNHRRVPMRLSLSGGYNYFMETDDLRRLSFDFFHAGALFGVRF